MPWGSPHQRTRDRDWLRWLLVCGAPLVDVVAVNAEAEKIGRYEADLFGLEPDAADDDAVSRGYQPALPVTFAD